ncbi:MAG TPA: PAS domain S-box protein, partial [Candidatus Brocadiia bacterium]|nr:PAS domain S-box protein [Candidatus Brocadiia bacterium]
MASLVCVIVAAPPVAGFYWLAFESERKEVLQELGTLAATAAAMLDGDLVATLRKLEQTGDKDYLRALEPLIRFHNANPRIYYLYTTMFVDDKERYVLDTAVAKDRLKVPWELKASTIMEEVLEADERGAKEESAAMREAIQKGNRYVFSKPYTDPVYGQFLTGSAPVFDSSGKVVGALNVDFSLETLNSELDGIRAGAAGALAVAVLVSLLGGFVYAKTRDSQDRALAERNEAMTQRQKTASDLENLLDKMIGAFSLQEMIYDAVGTPSDYRFLKVNAAFERMTGFKAADVTGRTAKEVFGQVEEELTLTYGRVVLSGEPRHLEWRDARTGRWHEITAYRAGEHEFACHYVDVTERHNAQEAVALNEERYRIAAMATGQVVYDLDVAAGVVAWEGAVEQVLGCKPEEARTIDLAGWEAMIHEEDRARVMAGLVRAREECGVFRAEYRLLRKDGATAVVEETGVFLPGPDKRAVRMIGAMNDVTQARAMENALRDSESRFRRLAENSMDMIALFDQAGVFVYVSPASVRITGYAPEELVGRRGDSFAHEEDAAAFGVALGQEAGEPGARTCLWRFRHKNGRYVWLETVAQRCADSGGSPARTVAVSRDMTDRMRAEAMLKTQHALALRLADADDLETALEAALDAVKEVAPACAVNVYLRCQEQRGFELAASRGLAPEHLGVARALGVANAMIRIAGGGKPAYFSAGDPIAKELIGDRDGVLLKAGAIIPLATH